VGEVKAPRTDTLNSLIKGKRMNIFKIKKAEQLISFEDWLKLSGGDYLDLKNLSSDNL